MDFISLILTPPPKKTKTKLFVSTKSDFHKSVALPQVRVEERTSTVEERRETSKTSRGGVDIDRMDSHTTRNLVESDGGSIIRRCRPPALRLFTGRKQNTWRRRRCSKWAASSLTRGPPQLEDGRKVPQCPRTSESSRRSGSCDSDKTTSENQLVGKLNRRRKSNATSRS